MTSAWQGQTHTRSTVEGFVLGGEEIERHFTIDIDEPEQLGGTNRFANPQEYLLAAPNSCMVVGYVALCAFQGITLESVEIDVCGDIDVRGFFALDDSVAPGYESLDYTVRIKGDATPEQFEEIHRAVAKTSPNFHNISQAVRLNGTLEVV